MHQHGDAYWLNPNTCVPFPLRLVLHVNKNRRLCIEVRGTRLLDLHVRVVDGDVCMACGKKGLFLYGCCQFASAVVRVAKITFMQGSLCCSSPQSRLDCDWPGLSPSGMERATLRDSCTTHECRVPNGLLVPPENVAMLLVHGRCGQ